METNGLHQNTIAILPLGATEQHGPHLPAETDSIIAQGIANRLKKQLAGELELQVLDTETIGYSPEHLDYPSTHSLTWDEAISRWIGIGEKLSDKGIKKLVLLNAHGGNSPLMTIVATELRVRRNMMVTTTAWTRFGWPDAVLTEDEIAFGIHGGDIETSVMLSLAPHQVNMNMASDFGSLQRELDTKNIWLRAYGRHAFGWKMQDLNPIGVTGNASAATAEKGEQLINHAIKGLSELLREVAQFDLEQLANTPQF